MTRLACLLASASLALTAGCSGDDHASDENVVRLDDASEEVMLTIRDLVDRGEAMTDDDAAPSMVSPADGAELRAASPPTFSWDHGVPLLRHGRTTGDFVWLSISCSGLAESIDVIAIETEEWTVDAENWTAITGAASECTATLVGAYVDRGVVRDGPYLRTTNPSYSITD
jgi:hypothetical protein